MKGYFTKTMVGLSPSDPETVEWFNKLKAGQIVSAEFKKVRNVKNLQRWFVLLTLAYDNWDPGRINSRYGVPQKNFDRFRSDVLIKAGYYKLVVRLDGSILFEPQSVSFAMMTEEEFQKLFSKTIDVLIENVYGSNMTKEEIENAVNMYLSFV